MILRHAPVTRWCGRRSASGAGARPLAPGRRSGGLGGAAASAKTSHDRAAEPAGQAGDVEIVAAGQLKELRTARLSHRAWIPPGPCRSRSVVPQGWMSRPTGGDRRTLCSHPCCGRGSGGVHGAVDGGSGALPTAACSGGTTSMLPSAVRRARPRSNHAVGALGSSMGSPACRPCADPEEQAPESSHASHGLGPASPAGLVHPPSGGDPRRTALGRRVAGLPAAAAGRVRRGSLRPGARRGSARLPYPTVQGRELSPGEVAGRAQVTVG
jgi:hypothetical protein